MSMESASAFFERARSDAELRRNLKELGEEKAGAYIREALGYDFTEDEIRRTVLERNPEIDDELEAVIGDNVGVAIGGLFGIGGVTGIGVAAEAAAGLTIFGIVAAGVAAA